MCYSHLIKAFSLQTTIRNALTQDSGHARYQTDANFLNFSYNKTDHPMQSFPNDGKPVTNSLQILLNRSQNYQRVRL